MEFTMTERAERHNEDGFVAKLTRIEMCMLLHCINKEYNCQSQRASINPVLVRVRNSINDYCGGIEWNS